VALLEKRRYLNNRSGDFPQVILIVPSHVPNINNEFFLPVYLTSTEQSVNNTGSFVPTYQTYI
jgi:hypothetical protein